MKCGIPNKLFPFLKKAGFLFLYFLTCYTLLAWIFIYIFAEASVFLLLPEDAFNSISDFAPLLFLYSLPLVAIDFVHELFFKVKKIGYSFKLPNLFKTALVFLRRRLIASCIWISLFSVIADKSIGYPVIAAIWVLVSSSILLFQERKDTGRFNGFKKYLLTSLTRKRTFKNTYAPLLGLGVVSLVFSFDILVFWSISPFLVVWSYYLITKAAEAAA